MNLFPLIVIAFLCLVFPLRADAANSHEHLYAYPTARSLVESFENLFGQQSFPNVQVPDQDFRDYYGGRMLDSATIANHNCVDPVCQELFRKAQGNRPITGILLTLLPSREVEGFLESHGKLQPDETLKNLTVDRQVSLEQFLKAELGGKSLTDVRSTIGYQGNAFAKARARKRLEVLELSLRDLFGPSPQPILRQIFGEQASAAISHLGPDAKVAECVGVLTPDGRDPWLALQSFFEMTAVTRHDRDAYIAMETVRKNLIKKSGQLRESGQEDFILQSVFSEWTKRVRIEGESALALQLTIPDEFVTDRLRARMNSLSSDYALKNIELYLSFPRSFLEPRQSVQEAQKWSSRVKELGDRVKSGSVSGVDITGSIREDEAKNISDPIKRREYAERIRVRIEELMELTKNGGVLRFHAFEAAADGAFYDAMFTAIANASLQGQLPEIRIGHVAELPASVLERLRRMQPIPRITFEANIESNLQIQKSELRALANKISAIHRAGFPVYLGADGQGILGESSTFTSTLVKLADAGLPKVSVLALLHDAFLPTARFEARGEVEMRIALNRLLTADRYRVLNDDLSHLIGRVGLRVVSMQGTLEGIRSASPREFDLLLQRLQTRRLPVVELDFTSESLSPLGGEGLIVEDRLTRLVDTMSQGEGRIEFRMPASSQHRPSDWTKLGYRVAKAANQKFPGRIQISLGKRSTESGKVDSLRNDGPGGIRTWGVRSGLEPSRCLKEALTRWQNSHWRLPTRPPIQ